MMGADDRNEGRFTVRIPADIDKPDRLVAGLTARQVAIFATVAALLYAGWGLTRTVIPVAVVVVAAIPVAATALVVVLGSRDGISLDRLVWAAVRQRLAPRYRVNAPEGVPSAPGWLTSRATQSPAETPAAVSWPAGTVGGDGVVDLGADGAAVIAACSPVNFALRTQREQAALVGAFAQFLHALTAPVQILIRTVPLDLSGPIDELRAHAAGLPHPALEAAARAHADDLAAMAGGTDLLRRQILLVFREALHPTGGMSHRVGQFTPIESSIASEGARNAVTDRLMRRVAEASDLLSAAGIVLTPLDGHQASTVLSDACNPDTIALPAAGLAGATDVITTTPPDDPIDVPWSYPVGDGADRRVAA
jgi:hypothetical protein